MEKEELIIKIESQRGKADEYEPPDNCQRENCTSCPEMKGRANGYRRAINDILSLLKEN